MENKINLRFNNKIAILVKVKVKKLIGCLEKNKYAIHVRARDSFPLNLVKIVKEKD